MYRWDSKTCNEIIQKLLSVTNLKLIYAELTTIPFAGEPVPTFAFFVKLKRRILHQIIKNNLFMISK